MTQRTHREVIWSEPAYRAHLKMVNPDDPDLRDWECGPEPHCVVCGSLIEGVPGKSEPMTCVVCYFSGKVAEAARVSDEAEARAAEHLHKAQRSSRWAVIFGTLAIVVATLSIVIRIVHG